MMTRYNIFVTKSMKGYYPQISVVAFFFSFFEVKYDQQL